MNATALKVTVWNSLDDSMHKDYCLYVDDISGFDWKLFFFLDKETGEWTDLIPEKSLPGKAYEECGADEVPANVMAAARTKRLEIIAENQVAA